jgi:hypothetical protein
MKSYKGLPGQGYRIYLGVVTWVDEYRAIEDGRSTGKNKILKDKSPLVPIHPSVISHNLSHGQTQSSAVRNQGTAY